MKVIIVKETLERGITSHTYHHSSLLVTNYLIPKFLCSISCVSVIAIIIVSRRRHHHRQSLSSSSLSIVVILIALIATVIVRAHMYTLRHTRRPLSIYRQPHESTSHRMPHFWSLLFRSMLLDRPKPGFYPSTALWPHVVRVSVRGCHHLRVDF